MPPRTPRYDHGTNVDTRLSRLETIIDSIGSTLEKIQSKLDNSTHINWTPIGLGLTIFMAVVGSFATIYTTHMAGTDANVKSLTEAAQSLTVASTEQKISIQTLKDRQDDLKSTTNTRFDDFDKRLTKVNQRVRALEGLKPLHDDDESF